MEFESSITIIAFSVELLRYIIDSIKLLLLGILLYQIAPFHGTKWGPVSKDASHFKAGMQKSESKCSKLIVTNKLRSF
jgi:hypothetical protein